MKFPIVVHKDADSDYGVLFPDIEGCFSAGSTIEEAISMAQEAAECHIEGLFIDGEPLPHMTPIEIHQQQPAYQNVTWAIVDIDINKLSLKSKRVNITLPENLLTAIDFYAKKHGQSRSGLLAHAVTEFMSLHH